ncbi:MAG: hypothetical protein DSZ29_00370 [Aquificaceae bacterium]|nr:MAG: hypothetical protein DSZ29_00370 [Aquificaceae bacterium]
MNTVTKWLLGSVLLIALGLGLYNLYQRLEIIESTNKISLEGEALSNPLYAARIFLRRMGIPASSKHSVQELSQLPDTNTVLLISSKRKTLSSQKIDALYAWVEAGGHLIVRMTQSFDYSKILSDEDTFSDDPLQSLLELDVGETIKLEHTQIPIQMEGSVRALDLEIKRFDAIDRANNTSTSDDEAIKVQKQVFILRRSIDKGMITVLANLDFINNRNIRKADHAEILWQLVHGLNTPEAVWLIHNDEMPALWRLMWATAWTFIVSLALLFILWLYRSSHRFGPLIPKAAEDRRSLIEHIAASGNFYWKHKQKHKLIESSREALNKRIALTHLGWQQLSSAEKIEQLATRLDLSQSVVHKLLFDQKVASHKTSADEFTELVKQLEEIRNSI